jgi:hypothetical protein
MAKGAVRYFYGIKTRGVGFTSISRLAGQAGLRPTPDDTDTAGSSHIVHG